MKKGKISGVFLYLLKIILAGILAVIILSGLMFCYSVVPVHIDNPNKNTDFVWPGGSVWVKATEGISFGKYDENGFNNIEVIDHPDILIIGSSHMEATNVMQDENVASLLNSMFKNEHSAYNLGISGHEFFRCCQYLPVNIELYKDSVKYAVIETSNLVLTQKDVDDVINHTVEFTPSHDSGIMGMMQKLPFVRRAYHQFEDGLLKILLDKKTTSSPVALEETELETSAYERLFEYFKNLETENNIEIIIFYHPTETFDGNGNIVFEEDMYKSEFSEKSEEYGIDFIDLTDDFTEMYNTTYKCAHGFITGQIGSGHLNKYGHKCAALAIYKLITEKETKTNVND